MEKSGVTGLSHDVHDVKNKWAVSCVLGLSPFLIAKNLPFIFSRIGGEEFARFLRATFRVCHDVYEKKCG